MTSGPETHAIALRVAEQLEGTCKSLEHVLDDLGLSHDLQTDPDFCNSLDGAIFPCEHCGWWCEPSEQNDASNGSGFLCDDCYDESDDD